MLCDNCKKNEATVHIKKLMNGLNRNIVFVIAAQMN